MCLERCGWISARIGIGLPIDKNSEKWAYVDEFRSNIARPLQEEVKDLRMEIAQLRNAIQRIGDCPHSATCPVRDSLQHESQGD